MSENKLGTFLREVSNWRWNEFWKAERDKNYTSNQALVFALVRSCAMQNLQAIKLSTNRLDGKLATPYKIETPKVYYLYPNAKSDVIDGTPGAVGQLEGVVVDEIHNSAEEGKLMVPDTPEEKDLPSMSIRETVAKMSDYPRDTPEFIVDSALKTEVAMSGLGVMPEEIPMVKSVMAAHLLIMAQNRDIAAISEVFDNIDGKLTETIKLLGEDLYITNYSLVAPEGAELNADGVMQMEATKAQDMWGEKLMKENKR